MSGQLPRPNASLADGSLTTDVEVTSSIDRQVYTPEEVAKLLGLHANGVYSMLKSGELPGMKAGRKWLISKRRFEAWLDGGDS
jgi:excisionase family DNA binding protein